MSRVLVTDGNGFIGSHVIETFRKAGHDARVLDIREDVTELNSYNYDIRNFGKLEKVFKLFRPEYVIHCVAKARI